LTPDPAMTVAEWADNYRILSGRAAAEAGKYRTSRTPYMREIMENLSPSSPVERVVFMKAAQTGATEAEQLHRLCHSPGARAHPCGAAHGRTRQA
ncbi:MAG: phage terminase large subunit family protein, partial [Verrucomicrobiaceae bacterium]